MWCLRTSPVRPRKTFDRLDCFWIASRQKSSESGHGLRLNNHHKRWSFEEDKKLLELYEQAAKERRDWAGFLARELGDRSVAAVKGRIGALRHRTPDYQSGSKTRRKWGSDEDSTIRAKLQQGVTHVELPKYLPGRSFYSITERIRHLRSTTDNTRTNCDLTRSCTEDQKKKIIHMRLKDCKTFHEIAAEFGWSFGKIRGVWRTQCAPLVSEKVLEATRDGKRWSQAETERLIELYIWTKLSYSEIALQFPSKTTGAIKTKISKLQLPFAKMERQAALSRKATVSAPVATPFATPVTYQKPRQTLGGFEQRRMFSSSGYILSASRSKAWTPEEDRKLLELEQRGFTARDIAEMLEGRTFSAVKHRKMSLKVGLYRTFRGWTPEEDTTILEKVRQGLKTPEISQYVPGRRLESVTARVRTLLIKEEIGTKTQQSCPLTSAEVQLIIQMRLNEGKTMREIAIRLGRSYACVQWAWGQKCSPLISEEALSSVQAASKNPWTRNEIEHLEELYNGGKLTLKKMLLHFPSRTWKAMTTQLYSIAHPRRRLPRPPKTSVPTHASQGQSQEPPSPGGVQSKRPTLSMSNGIDGTLRRAFSSCSRTSSTLKNHVWTEETDQKILELERQGMTASRIAASVANFFTTGHVKRRLRQLRMPRSSVGSRWLPEEDAIIMQGKQEGLRVEDIAAQLSGRGRSLSAVNVRWQSLKVRGQRQNRKKWSDAEVQHLIGMRSRERRSFADIARESSRSLASVRRAWDQRCVALLSRETLQEVQDQTKWTANEEKRLFQLLKQGLSAQDIASQFPSRTKQSIYDKANYAGFRFSPTPSVTDSDWIALYAALEPYIDQKPAELTRIYNAFPQFSKRQIVAALWRYRNKKETKTKQSDSDSVRVKYARKGKSA